MFDSVALQRLIAENARGPIDAYYKIRALACVEIWCRQFADAPAP
jgi:hypothetical protein